MKLRPSLIVTTIVTAIVTAAASMASSASAQILTVCASSTQSSATQDRFSPGRLADPIVPLSGRANVDDDGLIALWQDDKGFDILINWGKRDQHSLRDYGAQILGMAPSTEFVHLMVAHHDGGLEHFLFDLDANGSGELVRSSSDADVSDDSAVCVKPH